MSIECINTVKTETPYYCLGAMMLSLGLILFTKITPVDRLDYHTNLNCSGPFCLINNLCCYINNHCFKAWK